MNLMRDLLKAGYASLNEQSSEAGVAFVGGSQRQLAENLRMLQLQRDEVVHKDSDNEPTPRAPISPVQSPKGTTAAISDTSGNINMTPTGKDLQADRSNQQAIRATTSFIRATTSRSCNWRFGSLLASSPPYQQYAKPSIL